MTGGPGISRVGLHHEQPRNLGFQAVLTDQFARQDERGDLRDGVDGTGPALFQQVEQGSAPVDGRDVLREVHPAGAAAAAGRLRGPRAGPGRPPRPAHHAHPRRPGSSRPHPRGGHRRHAGRPGALAPRRSCTSSLPCCTAWSMTSSPTPPPKNPASQRPDREQPRSQACTRRPGARPGRRILPTRWATGGRRPGITGVALTHGREEARKMRGVICLAGCGWPPRVSSEAALYRSSSCASRLASAAWLSQ